MEVVKKIVTMLLCALAAASGVLVIVSRRAEFLVLVQANPLAVTFWVGLVCLALGVLLAWRMKLPQRFDEWRDIAAITVVILLAIGCGIYLVSSAGAYADKGMESVVIRTAIGWASAYLAAGFLAGFLFGVPRVLQGDGNPPNATNGGGGGTAAPYQQRVNTNLEQISDWLTKIIVGLGLVELKAVPAHLYKASSWMAQSLLPQAGFTEKLASFCCAFIVLFTILGFLAGYLLTRLFLAGAFWRAESQLVTLAGANFKAPQNNNSVQRVLNFWKPQGAVDAAGQTQLQNWLRQQGITTSLSTFTFSANFETQRNNAITALQIP